LKRIMPSTGRRHAVQADGPEQAGLDADPGEEDQGDEHDGRGEQAELDEQLRPNPFCPLLRGRCAGDRCPALSTVTATGWGCPAATHETVRFVPPNR
jgi:hypothetical protein